MTGLPNSHHVVRSPAAVAETTLPLWPEPARRASLWFLVLVYAIAEVPHPGTWSPAAAKVALALDDLSDGWLSVTLQSYLIDFVVVILVLICLVGKHPLRDLGLGRRGLIGGLVALAVFVLLDLALLALLGDLPAGPAAFARALVTHVLGVAVVEEIIFRGFLLRQIWSHLRFRGISPGRALALALAISSLLFAFWHPFPLDWFEAIASLDEHVLVGVVWGWLYARFGSLWLMIALHGVSNVALVLAHDDTARFVCDASFFVVALVLAALAPSRSRR
jgi:membrane protease YdiL (CAAX protease family)